MAADGKLNPFLYTNPTSSIKIIDPAITSFVSSSTANDNSVQNVTVT
jgi:hypothetical protein